MATNTVSRTVLDFDTISVTVTGGEGRVEKFNLRVPIPITVTGLDFSDYFFHQMEPFSEGPAGEEHAFPHWVNLMLWFFAAGGRLPKRSNAQGGKASFVPLEITDSHQPLVEAQFDQALVLH